MGGSSVERYVREMPYSVRFDVDSGRLDPIWMLTDADAVRLLADLGGSEAGTSTLERSLGCRGSSLSRSAVGSDARSAGGESDAATQAIEVFASGPPEIEERLQLGLPRLAQPAPAACPPCTGTAAPNYSPGRGSGRRLATLQCSHLDGTARRDGLGQARGWQAPAAGWYVALAIRPNRDYHWYRQDRNGCWSHKPGQAYVTDLDNAGKRLGDLGLADRGPYQTFCGYKSTDRNARVA